MRTALKERKRNTMELIKIDEMKDRFIKTLKLTGRNGINNVIEWLEESDFFTAPASTRFHCAYEGGLLEHSLNVFNVLHELSDRKFLHLADGTEVALPNGTIAITALLHDICKANMYKKTVRWRKDKDNKWESYDTFEHDEADPLGHGEKSVIILQQLGLELTEKEMYMIRWHMGGFDDSKASLSNAMTKHPEITLIHAADLIATYTIENRNGGEI